MEGTHAANASLWLPSIDIPAFHAVISVEPHSEAAKRLVQRVSAAHQVLYVALAACHLQMEAVCNCLLTI